MNKPAKNQLLPSPMPATGLSPADFPLGSPQSRAAARTILKQKAKSIEPTRDDFECSLLFMCDGYFTSHMKPSMDELERTPGYRRGMERDAQVGPNHQLDGRGLEWLRYFMTYGREPAPGDVLLYSDLLAAADEQLQWFIDAWKRQVPELVCPLDIRDGKVFRRVKASEYKNAALDLGWRWSEVPPSDSNDEFAWIEDRTWNESYPQVDLKYVGGSEWIVLHKRDS